MARLGDHVALLFSTLYLDGLCPDSRGVVVALDGAEVTRVLWDDRLEMELIQDGAVDTFRVACRTFVTKARKRGRVVIQFLGDDVVPPPPSPQKGDRVEFLFSTAPLSDGLHKGMRGEVLCTDDFGIIHVTWDNGAALGLIPDWDHFIVLPKKERGNHGAETG